MSKPKPPHVHKFKLVYPGGTTRFCACGRWQDVHVAGQPDDTDLLARARAADADYRARLARKKPRRTYRHVVGARHGRLVVTAKGPFGQWICRCDCGQGALVSGANLGVKTFGCCRRCTMYFLRHGH